MLKIEKKQVKIVSVVIAAFFLLGVMGIALTGHNITYAASSADIGIVDFNLLMSQHPAAAAAQAALQAAVDQAKQDFAAKSATMNNQDKQNYYLQVQQQLNAKKQELFAPIRDKVVAAIKQVADEKGLSTVLTKDAAIYGAQDITNEVSKKLAGQ